MKNTLELKLLPCILIQGALNLHLVYFKKEKTKKFI